MPFYAVRTGRQPGIFTDYQEVQQQVKGFSNACFKKFESRLDAFDFLISKSNPLDSSSQASTPTKTKDVNSPKNSKRNLDQTTSLAVEASSYAVGTSSDAVAGAEAKKAKPSQSNKKMTTTETTPVKEPGPITKKAAAAATAAPPAAAKSYLTEYEAKKIENFSFNRKSVQVYTDGACSNNGYSNAAAGIGVYWGPNHPLNISKRLIGPPTNIRAELTAAIVAISQALTYNASEVTVITDSQFVIKCMTEYIKGWKTSGWVLSNGQPVKNKQDVKRLDELCSKIKVTWKFIEAHKGHDGNTQADLLATSAIRS